MTDKLKQAQHFLKIEQELRIEAERKLYEKIKLIAEIANDSVILKNSELFALLSYTKEKERERIAQHLSALGYHPYAQIVRSMADSEQDDPIEPEEVVSVHTVVKDM